ncbi:MAG: hypothetical protein WBF66_04475 [Dehalococcoidia bacterium]
MTERLRQFLSYGTRTVNPNDVNASHARCTERRPQFASARRGPRS